MAAPAQAPAAEDAAADGEAELVRRARAGDVDAWARLYQRHFDGVFRHVCYLTGDPLAAEDLVQDTFALALVRLGHYRARSRFSTWLHGIALNVVRRHWRSRKATTRAHRRLAEQACAAGPPDGETVHRAELRRRRTEALYAALGQLPETQREAFVLIDLQGMAPPDAGAALGITPGNASVRAHRARQKIRTRLRDLGWIDDGEGHE